MANYTNLKSTINAQIKANGTGAITGPVLNGVLRDMVSALGEAGYLYKGVATPATSPGTPDSNVFYIASTAGTYTNFGGAVVADGEVAILKYNGTWTKEVTGAATAAQVTQLGRDVEDIIGFQQSVTSHDNGYSLDLDGKLVTNGYTTSRGVSDFLPVTGGSNVFIKSGVYQGGSFNYSYAAFYSSNSESSFVSRVYTTYGTEVTNTNVPVPANANYMRVVLKDNSVPAILQSYSGTVKEYVDENIEAVNDRIDDLPLSSPDAFMSDTSENAVQNKVIKSYIDSVTGYPITELPSNNNGYSLDNNGKLVTNGWLTARGVSDFFPVSGASLYVKSGVYQGGSNLYSAIAFYSADNENAFVGSYIHSTYASYIPAGYYSIPQGAQYARVVLGDNTTPAIVGGGSEKSIAERIAELSVISKNYGKSIVVFGGSHTARNNADAAKNVWRDKLGMDVYTAGVGSTGIVAHLTMYGWTYNGTTYYTRGGFDDGINSRVWDDYGYLTGIIITAKTESSITLSDGNTYSRDSSKDYESNAQTKVARLVSKSALNKDIYLIWLSTNDYSQGLAIGSYTDYTENDNYNTSKIYSSGNNGTCCGGFNYIVKTIRENNPTAEIYVFTSFRYFNNGAKGYDPYTTDANTTGKNFYEYQQEVLKAAQVAGCAILDQFMLQGIGINNYTEFYESDSLHLKVSGYERIADVQASFLSNGK